MKNKLKVFISVLCIAVAMAMPVMALADIVYRFYWEWVPLNSEEHGYATIKEKYVDDELEKSEIVGISNITEHSLEDDGSDFEYTGNHWQEDGYNYNKSTERVVPARSVKKE